MSVGVLELKDGKLQNRRYATKGIKTVTDKGFFGFEIVNGHLWLVYGAIKPDVVLTDDRHLIIDFDGNVDLEEVPSQTAGYPVGNVENLLLKEGTDSLTLTWSDPENIVFDGEEKATWAGTKVVRKEGAYPTSETDGVLIADSMVRDQYKESGLVDAQVEKEKQYNYCLFPYTDKNVYTMSDKNRKRGGLIEYYPVLADNTWEQIHKTSIAGLASEAWSIGDEKDGFKILDFNHDDLADGSGKAGITFLSPIQPSSIWNSLGNTSNIVYYKTSYICRNLSNNIFPALPQDLRDVIKVVKKPSATGSSTSITGVEDVEDKLFLLSYKEIIGSALAANGSQNEGVLYAKAKEFIGRNTWTRTVKQTPYKTYIAVLKDGSWPAWARSAESQYFYAFCI